MNDSDLVEQLNEELEKERQWRRRLQMRRKEDAKLYTDNYMLKTKLRHMNRLLNNLRDYIDAGIKDMAELEKYYAGLQEAQE